MGVYSEMDLDLHCSGECADEKSLTLEGAPPVAAKQPVEAPAPLTAGTSGETFPVCKGEAGEQADEAARRKAHEEEEAKRKAEWEERRQLKKAEEQKDLDRLAAMNEDEVMAASMKRVRLDTEKLTRRSMKECVAEYVQTLCLEDPAFARKILHPRKSMIRCFQYINRKAWEYIQDELKANDIQPGPGQNIYGSDIPDDLCYQWAADYFNDPEAQEDHEEEETFQPRPYTGGTKRRNNSVTKKTAARTMKKKESETAIGEGNSLKSEDPGQISFGDVVMPEGKAG